MSYDKPAIAVQDRAVRAIQGINKPSTKSDSCETSTANAYEADE